MKKYLKIILLFVLLATGIGAMFAPFGKAIESSNISKVWSFTLYNRIFGEGSYKNIGPLTLAWCLTLFGLILTILLIVLYFVNSYPTRVTLIVLYSVIIGFFLGAASLDFCACPSIGNTSDASLGIGTIITAIFLSLGAVTSAVLLLRELKSNDD